MTVLIWDNPGTRRYEYGIDRGVLYLLNGTAVAWNGLTSVTESEGRQSKEFYMDGRKFLDVQVPGDFSGTLKAFTYPDEFAKINGESELVTGVSLKNQPVQPFHLSYRTFRKSDVDYDKYPTILVTDNHDGTWTVSGDGAQMIEDGTFRVVGSVAEFIDDDTYRITTTGIDNRYIIHVLFNLLALPSDKDFATVADSIAPLEFSWGLTSTPSNVTGKRSTAHIIIDSSKFNLLIMSQIEDLLYGTDTTNPSITDLQSFITAVEAITNP